MEENQYLLLNKRRFLPLFLTQCLQALNDNLFKTSLVTLMVYQTTMGIEKIQLMQTLAAGLFILPFFLFSATAGQIADRFNKATVIQVIKFIEIFILTLGAYFMFQQQLTALLLLLFFTGVHSAFFGPLKYSILPDHLHKDELISGNAFVEASTFLAILLGSILGSSLIGAHFGLHIVSTLMIVASISGFVSSLFIPKTEPASPNLKISYNFLQETWRIISHMKDNREVFISILGISWFWFIGAMLMSQFASFAKITLGGNPSVFTLLLTMFSIGIALGSLTCNKLLNGEITSKFVPLGVFGISVFIFDLNHSSHIVVQSISNDLHNWVYFITHFKTLRLLIDVLGIATCGGIYVVPLYAILQSRTEPSYRSRTIASNNIMNSLFMVMSAAIIMFCYKILNMKTIQIFMAVGIINTVGAIYICKLLPEALIKSFVNWLLVALYKVEVKGMENYKAAGDQIIIIANHTSLLDIVLLSAFLPDKFIIAINTYVARKWWVKPFLALADTFPVDPTNPMGTKTIIRVIKAGNKCVIFPEGRLTETGSLMKVYEGPGMIADKSDAKLLPIRIDGAQYTPFSRMRGKVRIRWFPKITLTILPAEQFSQCSHLKGRARRRFMGHKLYNLMTKMMFESRNHHCTLFSALIDARVVHKGAFKIIEDADRKPMTYNQVIARSFILGNCIRKRSEKGERIGIMLPTSNAAALTFFAMQAYGRVPAMLNFSTGFSSLLSACHCATVKSIYTSKRFVHAAKLQNLVEQLTTAGLKIIFLEDIVKSVSWYEKLRGVLAGYFAQYEYNRHNPTIDPDVPAVVLFTSGSEGKPKGVALSHSNLMANSYQMQALIDFTARDIMFNAMPVFHTFGLTTGTILPLTAGIRTFFYPSPLHYRIVPELVYDTSATIMFGTDTFLTGYAHYAHTYDFFSIRYIFAGAEKLKPETRKLWAEKFGVRIFEGYGTTETAPVISTNTPMQHKLGTAGRFLPGMSYRLEPVEGISDGGRLLVSGPNVMLGYLRPEHPGVIDTSGGHWHDTGDIVTVDNEDYITIIGRAKRFAKIAGEMVSLTMVEGMLEQLWPEHRHAVIARPDPKKGEQLVLITDKQDAERKTIVAFVKQHGLNELGIPKSIHIVNTLPMLATGKVDYPELDAMEL